MVILKWLEAVVVVGDIVSFAAVLSYMLAYRQIKWKFTGFLVYLCLWLAFYGSAVAVGIGLIFYYKELTTVASDPFQILCLWFCPLVALIIGFCTWVPWTSFFNELGALATLHKVKGEWIGWILTPKGLKFHRGIPAEELPFYSPSQSFWVSALKLRLRCWGIVGGYETVGIKETGEDGSTISTVISLEATSATGLEEFPGLVSKVSAEARKSLREVASVSATREDIALKLATLSGSGLRVVLRKLKIQPSAAQPPVVKFEDVIVE